MQSIATIEAANTTEVSFNGQQLITAMSNGVAYVAMKPIVENLGMSWSSQIRKILNQSEKYGYAHMSIPSKSGIQQMLCIPLRKLNGWLFSINPAKVRADIRDQLIKYQEECFTVLYHYWTNVDKPKKTTTDERTGLRNAVNLLVSKKGLMYPDAYAMIHQRFNIDHLDQLEVGQLNEAVEYAHKLALDGEYLPAKPINPPANQLQDNDINNINALCHHMVCLKNAFYQYKLAGVFEALGSRAGVDMVGHISDGFCVANNVRNIVLKFEQNGLPESIAPVM